MFPHSAVRDLWWLAVAGSGAAARYVQLRARSRVTPYDDHEPIAARLLGEQSEHGYNAHSLVSIAPGANIWHCPEVDGAIVYNEFGKVWLVPGDPLADPKDIVELTRRFLDTAREEKRFVAFIPATERFAMQAAAIGLRAVKVGAAPYFDLTSWGPRGDRAKKARAGVNQARRAGVVVTQVERIDHILKAETSLLCESWLKARRCAMKLGWLFALDPFQHATRKRFFTARDAAGNLIGFLAASPMPAREGWYLEDVLRLPSAPVGTADLLVVEALNSLQASGAKLATLGTSPLAREGDVAPQVGNHELLAKLVRMAAGCFAIFYNFEGLRRFKMKFAPSWWESEYVLFPRDLQTPPRIIRAFIQAIAPDGASKLAAQQIARALRLERSAHKLLPKKDATGHSDGKSHRGPSIASGSRVNHENVMREIDSQAIETPAVMVQGNSRNYLGQFVSVDGLRLHYVSRGSGRPVVFVHGNPGSHQDYSMTLWDELAGSCRAYAFDRPGHGYSERRNGRSTTVEVQATLLRDALQKLGVEKPLIVGHSWGGSVALAMALQHEEDLSGLLLLAPAAYPSGSSQWWVTLPDWPLLGRVFLKTLTPLIGRRLIKDSLRDAYHPEPVQQDYLQAAEVLWTRPDQVKACAHDDQSLNESLSRLSNHYAEIKVPVVIVTGDSDRLLKPEDQADRLHRAIQGSELVRLPQTGHQIPHTHPKSVIEALKRTWELVAQHSISPPR
ncbi:MAG: putative rane protein [Acidobacteria bacterium]|nr:putative rane protein [Acidobacteriota bacterium]